MTSSSSFFSPAARGVRRGLILGVFPLLTTGALAPALLAQDAPPPPDAAPAAADTPPPAPPDTQMQGGGNGNGGDNSDREARRAARRGNFTPEAMLAALKTRFGVTDDAEWAIISARITAIMDLRRATGGGFGGGFPGGFRGGDNNRQGNSGNPELDALRAAVTDNMPDGEIKARLDRFREVRKDNEAKLEKARADLQAVLSVKQEAVAVMMGLLQ
jgi:hypothetical protein